MRHATTKPAAPVMAGHGRPETAGLSRRYATAVEIASQLTEEDRKCIVAQLRDVNALNIEDAIARAPKSHKDARGKTRRLGHPLGKLIRQGIFWDGKSELDRKLGSGWFHKTATEWEEECGITPSQLRTATRVGVEEGLLETELIYRPSDRRQTIAYRVNPWAVAQIVAPNVVADLESLIASLDSDIDDFGQFKDHEGVETGDDEECVPGDDWFDRLGHPETEDTEPMQTSREPEFYSYGTPATSTRDPRQFTPPTEEYPQSTSEEVPQESSPCRGQDTAFAAPASPEIGKKKDSPPPTEQRNHFGDGTQELLALRRRLKTPNGKAGRTILDLVEQDSKGEDLSR